MTATTVATTARLSIRHFTLADAPFILELLNDKDWLRFIGNRNVRTLEDARRYLSEGPIAMQAARGFSLWAVDRTADRLTLGMCGLIKRDTLDDVDIGYAFLPSARGQGYAREAAAAVLAQGFDVHGLRRIVAITDPSNHASARVLESVGLRFQRLVQLAKIDGDSALYAIERD